MMFFLNWKDFTEKIECYLVSPEDEKYFDGPL